MENTNKKPSTATFLAKAQNKQDRSRGIHGQRSISLYYFQSVIRLNTWNTNFGRRSDPSYLPDFFIFWRALTRNAKVQYMIMKLIINRYLYWLVTVFLWCSRISLLIVITTACRLTTANLAIFKDKVWKFF